ncbi:tyrosine-protein phosphatase [Pseudonocardia sp. GCM10023141]|uniref:tyrosine-protein phosphatase n=1 Tax=Pseudonocardia sp. GCM10023141 TaxID=3252653 RepID=UPI00362168B5
MYDGALNFREVGGLPTADGRRRLRRGLLYRSGTPQLMSEEAARRMVEETGIRLVVDLRQEKEAAEEGQGGLAAAPHTRISAPFLVAAAQQAGSSVPVMQAVDPLVPHYLGYLPSSEDSILRLFRALADPATGPALLHCTAGKDRTGAAVMLVLDAVGIDRGAIVGDYVAGKDEIAAVFDTLIALPSYGERLAALPAEARTTERETAERYLVQLDLRFGGIRGWLRDHGFTADELRALEDTLTEDS